MKPLRPRKIHHRPWNLQTSGSPFLGRSSPLHAEPPSTLSGPPDQYRRIPKSLQHWNPRQITPFCAVLWQNASFESRKSNRSKLNEIQTNDHCGQPRPEATEPWPFAPGSWKSCRSCLWIRRKLGGRNVRNHPLLRSLGHVRVACLKKTSSSRHLCFWKWSQPMQSLWTESWTLKTINQLSGILCSNHSKRRILPQLRQDQFMQSKQIASARTHFTHGFLRIPVRIPIPIHKQIPTRLQFAQWSHVQGHRRRPPSLTPEANQRADGPIVALPARSVQSPFLTVDANEQKVKNGFKKFSQFLTSWNKIYLSDPESLTQINIFGVGSCQKNC